jgi:hypothetical protein
LLPFPAVLLFRLRLRSFVAREPREKSDADHEAQTEERH